MRQQAADFGIEHADKLAALWNGDAEQPFYREREGVWGGMTERERRALLRRRSNVTSWRELLMSARQEYDRLDPVAFVSSR